MKINLTTEGLTEKEKYLCNQAVAIAEQRLNSEEFRDFILTHSYIRKTYTGKLWWKKEHAERIFSFESCEYTRAQIYQSIMDGREVLSPELDNEADIFLKVDPRSSRSVIGYTYPNTNWQWIYRKVLNSWGPKDVAGNLVHEWCHKLGFGHTYDYTVNRQYSVPYAVGYFVSK